ncbi:hypothetical protein [Leptolyngbya sp. GB1-A1]|uniref:calcium-binding protein n=1 Tax=Leptolyngbya sp. GB1-A1 TaxID=2933908 RepID=UPI0032989352
MAQVFETANNDTFATATKLGNIRNGPFVRGSLLNGDNFDFFKFQVDVPVKGGIAVVPQGIDANLVLFDSSGQQIRNSLKPGTATEGISFDNLPTGEYNLLVSKSTGSGSYTLSASGNAITRAQLSTTVDRLTALERFDTPVPFTRLGEADFYFKLNKGFGEDTDPKRSKVFKDNDDISPNLTLTQDFNISELKPVVFLDPKDSDGSLRIDDDADIHPFRAFNQAPLEFDVLRNEVVVVNGVNVRARENEVITLEGDGGRDFLDISTNKARISFRVNYDTFTSSTSSFSNSTPLVVGTNASQDLTGKNQGGILCGEGGNDKLSGMGGNDALCGGTGNDIHIGGTGNDISFGGAGNDTHMGGSGKDTFVLALNNGVDIVKDFQKGEDKVGLSMELNPEILDIVQRGRNTVIGVGGERLATLLNVKANQINAADFATVDFSHFKGMEVPTLVS